MRVSMGVCASPQNMCSFDAELNFAICNVFLGHQLAPSARCKAATAAAHKRAPSSVAELNEDERADAGLGLPAAHRVSPRSGRD